MFIDFQTHQFQKDNSSNDFEQKVSDFLHDWYSENATVPVQTSGSTAAPKVFEVEKNKMRVSAKMTCDFLQLNEGDSALLCLPVEYISGKMMVVRSVVRKLKMWIAEPSLKPLENLQDPIDFCALTPLQPANSLENLHLVRKLIIGGAAVSESLKKEVRQALANSEVQPHIYETYGMSETLSHIAMKEIFPDEEEVFSLLPGVEISTDQRGCLRIDAPGLNDEILQTNDLVALHGPRQFKFLGRFDNVINSGGVKIYPEQLESVIKKYIPNELAVIGLPDEYFGQKLALAIEGTDNILLRRLINEITFEKPFHRPKEIFFIENFPRTPNGKVNRRELLNCL